MLFYLAFYADCLKSPNTTRTCSSVSGDSYSLAVICKISLAFPFLPSRTIHYFTVFRLQAYMLGKIATRSSCCFEDFWQQPFAGCWFTVFGTWHFCIASIIWKFKTWLTGWMANTGCAAFLMSECTLLSFPAQEQKGNAAPGFYLISFYSRSFEKKTVPKHFPVLLFIQNHDAFFLDGCFSTVWYRKNHSSLPDVPNSWFGLYINLCR